MCSLQNKHILFIVENLPVPFDRRVWLEASALKDSGAIVSIICPKMKGFTSSYETINGIEIYRHILPIEGNGPVGYLLEYGIALFYEFLLSWRIFFKKRFHIIHGCNPPDLIFLVAFSFKIFGVKYVFDHHDINPELYIAKFKKKGFFYKIMVLFERLTFASADFSIATNESYKEIAIRRGKMVEDKIRVIRSGPKLEMLTTFTKDTKYHQGRKYLVGYLGIIGKQDGIDLLLESIKYIISLRKDIQFAIVGGGSYLNEIIGLSSEMGLNEFVDFYGKVPYETMIPIINSADVCVDPDPLTEMNNLSTMNKIMEYMALKKPIVQYDLKEGRFSAQNASLYAECGDIKDFADKIMQLIDNPEQRVIMAENGYKRILNEISWNCESIKLINFYKSILSNKKVSIFRKYFRFMI
jgi:glycosyltransferase involved in cell wall biosynthesis